MLYKIIHKLVELPLPDYIIPASCSTRGNLYSQPHLSIHINTNSIIQWNKLPDDITTTSRGSHSYKVCRTICDQDQNEINGSRS